STAQSFIGTLECQPTAARGTDEQASVGPPGTRIIVFKFEADARRAASVHGSVDVGDPDCQVSTLGGSLSMVAFSMPKCTGSVPKPMNSGYSGPAQMPGRPSTREKEPPGAEAST